MTRAPDHLYFVAEPATSDGSRWVKIGRTKNIGCRLDVLQTGNPRELSLLGYAIGCGGLEKTCHRKWLDLRGCGEWFHFDLALLLALQSDVSEDCVLRPVISRRSLLERLRSPRAAGKARAA
ncbi:MAG: GIY-YIG nuclease family protein [Myxococcota bacterium]|jgi:hypothetical protein|nr:GIY-YIG nuclease family protein [Myxococcota bacterium]